MTTFRPIVAVPSPRFCPECADEAKTVEEVDLGAGTDPVLFAECLLGHVWPVDSFGLEDA